MQPRTTTLDLTRRLALDESNYAVNSEDEKSLKEKAELKSAEAAKAQKVTKSLTSAVKDKEIKHSVAVESEKDSFETAYDTTECMIKHICSLSLNPEEDELSAMVEYLRTTKDEFIAKCKEYPRLAELRHKNFEGFIEDAAIKLTEKKYEFSASMAKLIELFTNINKELKPFFEKQMAEQRAKEESGRAHLLERLKAYSKERSERENTSIHHAILKDYFTHKDYKSVLNYIKDNLSDFNISLCTYIAMELQQAQLIVQSIEDTTLLIDIASLSEKAESALQKGKHKDEWRPTEKEHKHQEKKDDWVVVKSKPLKPSSSIVPHAPSAYRVVEEPTEEALRALHAAKKLEEDEAADLERAIKMSMSSSS